MNKIAILLVSIITVAILLVSVIIVGNIASAKRAISKKIDPSKLQNVTGQQEHQLMLQKLAQKKDVDLGIAFYYELLARSIGNSFYLLEEAENSTRENNAIIRAWFDVIENLLIQDWAMTLFNEFRTSATYYYRVNNSLPLAFSLACGHVDQNLKNETLFMTLKDQYRKQSYSPPQIIYLYGLPKSLNQESALVEQLLNEPRIKPLFAHMAWFWTTVSSHAKLKSIHKSVMNLARVTDKFQTVQKIYKQSIEEVIPHMKHLNVAVTVSSETMLSYFEDLQFNVTEKIWSRIVEEIPDWKDYSECETTLRDRRCGQAQVGKDLIFKSAWPVMSDFGPFQLQNLTLQQEHNIFLKKLASQHSDLTTLHVYLELRAKSIGNDFFGLIEDESLNIRNNAIVKAAFECLSNLKFQRHALEAISSSIERRHRQVAETGDTSQAFVEVCSSIDNGLKNETFYTTKRDEYMKQMHSTPKKTYQYGVGKPTEDQAKIIAELFNDHQTKKNFLHSNWVAMKIIEPIVIPQLEYSIREMAHLPSKTEIVQRIYEQSIEKTVPLVKNFTYDQVIRNIDLYNLKELDIRDFSIPDSNEYKIRVAQFIIREIKKYPCLVGIFLAISDRYNVSMVQQNIDGTVVLTERDKNSKPSN